MSADIEFYGLSTCAHCKNAKEYLEECGESFDCVYVDRLSGEQRSDIMKVIKDHNPAMSFPTMVINGVVVIGYNKDKIDKARKGD